MMTITLRPEIERGVQEAVQDGTYQSPDEMINEALKQFLQRDADELNRLLDEGEEDIAAGRVVAGADVTRMIEDWPQTRRSGS